MIVDDNITNLTIVKKALFGKYSVVPATSGEGALSMLQKTAVDIILLDVEMPGMNGFDMLKILKQQKGTRDIPVIFVTSRNDSRSELDGFSLGAVDYIIKPYSIPLLIKRLELHLTIVEQKNSLIEYTNKLEHLIQDKSDTIIELQNAILHTMTDLIGRRDDITGTHITRTQGYLKVLVDALEQSEKHRGRMSKLNKAILIESAQLHDIGKIAIPDRILLKRGRLTSEEQRQMKRHTIIGEEALLKAMTLTREKDFLTYAAQLAISHHEKWDGTGYPYCKAGEDIPFIGRIMAIADVYDALVSVRPYKMDMKHSEAVEIIKAQAGKHFDQELVEVFMSVEQKFEEVSHSLYIPYSIEP